MNTDKTELSADCADSADKEAGRARLPPSRLLAACGFHRAEGAEAAEGPEKTADTVNHGGHGEHGRSIGNRECPHSPPASANSRRGMAPEARSGKRGPDRDPALRARWKDRGLHAIMQAPLGSPLPFPDPRRS